MASALRNSYSTFSKFLSFSHNLFKTARSPVSNLKPSRLIWVADVVCARRFHFTRQICGIEEFFPPGALESNEPLPEEVQSGRSWRAGELRQKSNEDLHKLWYVLLKERNMLLTVQWEARRQNVLMPSPQRLHKVKKSMAMVKVVIGERKSAIDAIETRAKEKQTEQDLVKGDSGEQKEILSDPKEHDEQLRQVPLTT